MSKQFVVAQAGSTSSSSTAAPVQIIKVIKPEAGHTEIFHASYDGTVKIDFTAIANEKITLYHDQTDQTLHIIFTDGAQAIIEPFFDSMGVMSNMVIEVAPNQDLTGAQFATQFPITQDQSVLPAAGPGTPGTPASGADFHDVSVIPLETPPPLPLLPPEELPPVQFHNIEGVVLPGAAPIPVTGGVSPATATVNEAALDTAATGSDLGHGSVTGSNPGSTAETTTGTLTFSDPDVPVTVTGVAAGNSGGSPVSGNVSTTITGTYGLLQVDAAGHYTYTLTTPYTTSPPANNGAETEPGKDVFSFTVTDAFGNTNTSTISISIIDDVPTAQVDSNSAESGQTVTGNVETNDTAGADGIASIAWTGAVGSTVTGAHGVLTVATDGTYSYHANANTSGSDVFNYTITDGDGDTSPSTLTINVTNGQPSVSPATATVNEAALDTAATGSDLGHGSVTGSNPGSTAETTTGTLTFSDPDVPVTVTGVAAGNSGGSPVSGNVSTTITGTYGLLQVDAAGHYTYTLTTPYTTSPPANNGAETEPGKDVFSFTVTDAFGNTNTSTISISIIDDVPTAQVDSNSAESGQTVTGNVETNDTAGADGIASIAWTGAVGSTVTGAHGVLTVATDGTYSYHANANTSGSDVFNYTITDGDGDTSPSTLTINVTNGQPSVSPATATVNEAALDTAATGSDLGHGSVTGSNPGSTAETTTGTLTFSDPDVPVTVTGVAAGNSGGSPVSGNVSTTITGTYGLLQVDAAGHYTYTLTTPYTTSPPANNGAETEPGKDVFSFTVTDAFGNTNTSTISISIIDDVPTAQVDSNSAESGQTVTGNVETNDTAGADGIASIAWTGAVGSTVTGAHGVLTVATDGTYSYHANANTSGSDVFNYTITDGDGDTSPSTLTINVTNGQPSVSPATATVNEAALDTAATGSDLGHGSVTGSNPGSTAETTTGTLTFSDPDVPVTVTGVAAGNSGGSPVSGNVSTTITGTYGLLQVDAAGHYTYTLTTPYTTSPPANNGAETEPGKDVFSFTVTDAFGNTNTSTISISIIDDVPTAQVDSNSAESGQTVTGNVETNDTAGADGIASIAWTGAVGSTVTGAHGVLTVATDGTYSYHANANTSGSDVFNYTITDGDGDTSPSTLTINVTNGQPSVSPATATVNEAALDTAATGSDLGHGSVTGSNPGSTAETTTGTLTFSDPDVPVTVTGVAAGNSGGSPVSGNVSTTITGTYGLLQVDAAGHYTYTLTTPYTTSPPANNGAETEPGKDVFSFTVTDAFGNTNTSTISISIIDDVPSIATIGTGPALNVDESFIPLIGSGQAPSGSSIATGDFHNLFTVTPGADGLVGGGTTPTYSLTINAALTNLIDSKTNTAVTLVQVDSQHINAVDGSSDIVFQLSVNSSGVVTLTDLRGVHQASADAGTDSNETITLAGLVSLTATVTDNDGDTASSSVDLGSNIIIHDDGPLNIIPGLSVLLNSAGATATAALDVDTNVDNNYGADGGNTHFSAVLLNGSLSGLTSGGHPIQYWVSTTSTFDDTLTGFVDNNANNTYDSGTDTLVFTINLNLDGSVAAATDTYTVHLNGPIDAVSTISFTGSGFIFVGGNDPWAGLVSTTQNTDLLLTPEVNGLPASTVNSSNLAGGVGSGNSLSLDVATSLPESLRLDFVNDLGGIPAKQPGSSPGDYSNPVNQDHTFSGHYLVNGASATISQTIGSMIEFVATIDPDTGSPANTVGTEGTGPGPTVNLTAIDISFFTGTQLISLAGFTLGVAQTFTIGGHDFTVTTVEVNGHTEVEVGNVIGGTNAGFTDIAIFGETTYNSLEITYVSGDTFKLGGFGANTTTTAPVDFAVPLTVNDGDLDTTNGAINVFLMPNAPTTQDHSGDANNDGTGGNTYTSTLASPDIMGSAFIDTLNGNGNANILYGGAGNDILNGNGGDDTLIGGAGDDTLTGGAGNDKFLLQVTGGGHDTILDLGSVAGNTDQIFVDVGNQALTIATAVAPGNFITSSVSVPNESSVGAWNGTANSMFFNQSSHELWYSASGTGADKIDLAHISTGVPTAANVHTF